MAKPAMKPSKDAGKQTKSQETKTQETKSQSVVPAVKESALMKTVNNIVAQAKAFVIKDNDDFEKSQVIRANIKSSRAQVRELLGEQVEAAYNAHKTAKEKFNSLDNPLKESDDILKVKQKDHIDRMERERLAAARKAEDDARKKAEEDKQAEVDRLIEEGRYEDAEMLANGEIDQHEIKVDREVKREVASIVPQVDRRTLGRDKWVAVVTDEVKLLQAAARGDIPYMSMMPNQKFLDSQAKVYMSTEAMNYPGVVVKKES